MKYVKSATYVYPYLITSDVISFAISQQDGDTKCYNNKSYEFFNDKISDADVIVTKNFNKIFKENFDKQIYDVNMLEMIIDVKSKIDKDKKLTKKYDKLKAFEKAKINAFRYADPDFISDKRFEILPLQFVFPQYKLIEHIDTNIDYLRCVFNSLSDNDLAFYSGIFKNYLIVYSNLSEVKASDEFIATINTFEKSGIIKQILDKKTNDGYFELPRYNLFSSKTGRPYIVSGTNWQQLSKKHKNVIKSRWDDGKIVEFDYNGCEIRAAFYVSGNTEIANIQTDVYEYILDYLVSELEIKEIERKKIKNFVILFLFGASKNTLARLVKLSLEETERVYASLNKLFNVQKINELVLKTKSKTGINNFFRRQIVTNEQKTETLVQNYIQSTAIDICHSGYASLVKHIVNNKLNTKVLYTKHDAIKLDVHPDELVYLDKFKELLQRTEIEDVNFLIKMKID